MEAAHRQHPTEDEDFFPTNLPMSAAYEELVLEPWPHYDNRRYVPAMWLGPLNCVSSTMPEWLLPLLVWPYIDLAKQGKHTAFIHARMDSHILLYGGRAIDVGPYIAKYERDLEHRMLYRWNSILASRAYRVESLESPGRPFFTELRRITNGFKDTWNGGRRILPIRLDEMQPPAPPPFYPLQNGDARIWWGAPGVAYHDSETQGQLWLPTYYERSAARHDSPLTIPQFANARPNWV